MSPSDKSRVFISFADYEFGADKTLWRQGVRLHLKYQSAQLLSLLLDRAGELVTRDEIRDALWEPDTFVDFDRGINNCIREIRSVLHDQPDHPSYIETVSKLGYLFLAPVHRPSASTAQVEPHPNRPSPFQPIQHPVLPDSSGREAVSVSEDCSQARPFFNPKKLPIVAFVLVMLWGAVWVFFRWSRPVHAERAGRETIAVLPFTCSTTDRSGQYLSEGMTESVINDLGSLGGSGVSVIARTSSNAFIGLDKSVQQIGHELEADYVVRGRIEPLGDSFKLTAELVRTRDAESLWTYQSDWTTSNIMKADGEIARGIAENLSLNASEDLAGSSEFSHMSPGAYHHYMAGRHDLNEKSRASLLRAAQEFKSAIEEEPDSGPAYASLADADNLLAFYGGSSFYKSVVEAEGDARHAIQIDDSLAEAHAALAYSDFMWGWQWSQSEQEFQKALALNPNYAAAHHWYALYLAAMGRFPEAREQIVTAEQLNPLSAIVYAGGGYVDYMARDYVGAVQQAHVALALNPKLMPAYAVLGMAYSASGNPEKAIAPFQEADRIAGGSIFYRAGLARAYARAGQPESARKLLAMLGHVHNDDVTSSLRAQVLESLGDHQGAVELLYKAYERNDPSAVWFKVDPQYDSLRSEPTFQELLRRMDFPR